MVVVLAGAMLGAGVVLNDDPAPAAQAFDAIGTVHVLAAGLALAAGSAVAVAAKGTARHRAMGRLYLGAMLALNASALLIYDLTGRPNPFHAFALVSLASVLAGVVVARRRRPGWRERHARTMLWSYVGLLAAATSELIVRVPGLVQGWIGFGAEVGLATTLTCGIGAWCIQRAVARLRRA